MALATLVDLLTFFTTRGLRSPSHAYNRCCPAVSCVYMCACQENAIYTYIHTTPRRSGEEAKSARPRDTHTRVAVRGSNGFKMNHATAQMNHKLAHQATFHQH